MGLTLEESEAVSQLASYVYGFLPGKPHPYADQHISFQGVAHDLGIPELWPGGSKEPAIASLFEGVLQHRRELFCKLLVEVVRRSMRYRRSKEEPLTREEVAGLNDLVARVGFKIPELWNSSFLDRLPVSAPGKKKATAAGEAQARAVTSQQLGDLRQQLLGLSALDPQSRGFAFEKFLNELFSAFRLAPRGAFRLVGEQIDGSFELGDDTYLVEAKWQATPVAIQSLLAFDGKVTGKARWSRGIFVSYSAFSREAIEAFGRGRPASFVGFNAADLYCILEGRAPLSDAVRLKARRAVETGGFMTELDTLLRESGR